MIISPEPWGTNFVSKHHYAMELSINNRVYFLNPPSKKNTITLINENLKIIDYHIILRGINRAPTRIRNYINSYILLKIKKLCKISNFDIIWSFDPFRFQNFRIFKSKLCLYHAVDIHDSKLEKEAVRSANIVLASSQLILKRLNENENRYLIGHGLANQFLLNESKNIINSRTPIIGYVGNLISNWLDIEVLKELIDKYSYTDFHFVGPYTKSNLSNDNYKDKFIKYLEDKNNVKLYGPVSSIDLPKIINNFDVLLLTYSEQISISKRSNPHKILEYLSTGKVIVSSFIDEYKNKLDLIEMASNNRDLIRIFDNVISNLDKYNSLELQSNRKRFATKNTYKHKLNEIESILDKTNT